VDRGEFSLRTEEGVWFQFIVFFIVVAVVLRFVGVDFKGLYTAIDAVQISREDLRFLVLKVDGLGGIGEPLGLQSRFEEAGAGCEYVGVQGEALRRGCFADDDIESVCKVISEELAQF
jgi:hypothetical protein